MSAMIISYVKEDLIDGVLSLCAIGQNVLLLLQVFLGDSGILPVELVASFRILSSAILVLMAIYGILYRECYLMIGTYIFMSLLFILSYFFFPDNNEYLIQDGIRFTFFINIPVFLSVISIRNSAVFFDYALRMSYICTIIAVLYAFFYFTDNLPALDGSYNMSYGYGILFPALFLLYRSGKSNTILFSVLFICILFIGSRGPLLFIVTFLFIRLFFFATSQIRLLLLLLISIFFLLVPIILNTLQKMLINGISSRTLYLLLSGEISNDTGRDLLQNNILEKIMEAPIWGYGIFADRFFLNGSYCHNVLLEVAVDFGLPLAFILILIFLYLIYSSIRKAKQEYKLFIILVLCSCFLPLFVSSSFLINYTFYFCIGVLLVFSKKKWFLSSS